jgi:hypothetical protein
MFLNLSGTDKMKNEARLCQRRNSPVMFLNLSGTEKVKNDEDTSPELTELEIQELFIASPAKFK